MDGDNTSNDDLAAFDAPRPDPLAALAEEHARALDAECAAYLAAHGAEMVAELAAAAATRREGGA